MQRDGGPGAGGAGNPTGASFTGPAEALEIIGDHAFAYSGQLQIDTTPVTHLDFTSGNYYLVGEISFIGATIASDPDAGARTIFLVTFNDADLFTAKTESVSEDMPQAPVVPIIIPPYTEVKITVDSNTDTAGMITSVNITGRIYRGR